MTNQMANQARGRAAAAAVFPMEPDNTSICVAVNLSGEHNLSWMVVATIHGEKWFASNALDDVQIWDHSWIIDIISQDEDGNSTRENSLEPFCTLSQDADATRGDGCEKVSPPSKTVPAFDSGQSKQKQVPASQSDSTWLDCGAGKYVESIGKWNCTLCWPEKYSWSIGASLNETCLDCEVGIHLETSGTAPESDCVLCVAGKFSETVCADSVTLCTNYKAGTYSPIRGNSARTKCTLCEPGTYSSALGALHVSSSSICVAGKYGLAAKTSFSECKERYQIEDDQSDCQHCEAVVCSTLHYVDKAARNRSTPAPDGELVESSTTRVD